MTKHNDIDPWKGLSFRGLFEYVDFLADLYQKNSSNDTLWIMVNFYKVALSSNRLKTQREYCKAVLFDLNSDFAAGFFKTKK